MEVMTVLQLLVSGHSSKNQHSRRANGKQAQKSRLLLSRQMKPNDHGYRDGNDQDIGCDTQPCSRLEHGRSIDARAYIRRNIQIPRFAEWRAWENRGKEDADAGSRHDKDGAKDCPSIPGLALVKLEEE